MMALGWRAAPYLGLLALALVLWEQGETITARKTAIEQANEAITTQWAICAAQADMILRCQTGKSHA